MLGYFHIVLFGLFFVAIRIDAEEDIKGLIDFLKTIQTDDPASYPVISIRKEITPDNVEIYEADINANSSPEESDNNNSKPQSSLDTIEDETNVDSMLPASDLVKTVNKNDLHRHIEPIDMHYHKHGSGWWPGFNQRFHSRWRPGGRNWPSHYNYGYHNTPHGHNYHNGHNNNHPWSNQGNQGYSPNYWNSHHDHNNPNNYNPSYYERPFNNHNNFYHHHHPYKPCHNNDNNDHPNYFENKPLYNESPSENNGTNNPYKPVFSDNSNEESIHQNTENPITNNNDEDLIKPNTNAPPPEPQTEASPGNNGDLEQLFTEIFGVPTTTSTTEEFFIDQRMKDESADALIFEQNNFQVKPVTPE